MASHPEGVSIYVNNWNVTMEISHLVRLGITGLNWFKSLFKHHISCYPYFIPLILCFLYLENSLYLNFSSSFPTFLLRWSLADILILKSSVFPNPFVLLSSLFMYISFLMCIFIFYILIFINIKRVDFINSKGKVQEAIPMSVIPYFPSQIPLSFPPFFSCLLCHINIKLLLGN